MLQSGSGLAGDGCSRGVSRRRPDCCARAVLPLPRWRGRWSRRAFFVVLSGGTGARPNSVRRLRCRGRARSADRAGRAVEGHAAARHRRGGEAVRRRAVADRARRQRRRQIGRPARRAALFLVRRRRVAGRGHVARNSHAAGRSAGCGTITREIAVRADAASAATATAGSVWPLHNTWNRATENLYSAWIEKLFDGPLDAELSWPTLL